MSGYKGYSMSNNAVEAYKNGEKPYSRWTKANIIEAIEKAIREDDLILKCSMEKLNKTPAEILKLFCLSYSSWHHTSKRYNKTDFYILDINRVACLTDEKIDNEIAKNKNVKKTKPKEEKWKCAFLEWGGTKRHPKSREIIEIGTVKGNWFYRSDGSKKSTTSNGFRFIEKLSNTKSKE